MFERIAEYLTGKKPEYRLTDTISRNDFVDEVLIPSMGKKISSQVHRGVRGIELYILKPRFTKVILDWHDFERYVNQDTDAVDFKALKSELKERVKSTLSHPEIKEFQTMYKGACAVNTELE